MSRVNSITICRDNYRSKEEWEEAVGKMVVQLLHNRQIMTVRYDEPGIGIVVIEFNYDRLDYGNRYPVWLYPEEEESVVYQED